MKKIWHHSIIALSVTGLIILLTGCATTQDVKPFSLTIWGVQESGDEWSPLIKEIISAHPGVKISYQQKNELNYRQELLEALAAGKGPDIFAVPAGELNKYEPLLQASPSKYTLPIKKIKKTIIQQQEVVVSQDYTGLTVNQLNKNFVKTVAEDVVLNGKIMALPLAVDTIMLGYNQSLLDAARIPQPPTNWTTFKDSVVQLTKRDSAGEFRQIGAAMGGGSNITNSADIVMMIMMQNGVAISKTHAPNFTADNEDEGSAAAEALRFYTDFAQPTKETYTWNTKQPSSLEMLGNGRAAMGFITPLQAKQIRQQHSSLPLVLTTVPQLNDDSIPITVANYWVYGVAKKSPNATKAWGILQQVAANKNLLTSLAKTNKRGPTLREVAQELQNNDDSEIVALANQSLAARSWYHGFDKIKANQGFNKVIESVLKNEKTVVQALSELNTLIRVTYNP